MKYLDPLNFSASKHELNPYLTLPYGGETGDSSPYCRSSRRFSSHLRPWLGLINIHAAAKKGLVPMKGAIRSIVYLILQSARKD